MHAKEVLGEKANIYTIIMPLVMATQETKVCVIRITCWQQHDMAGRHVNPLFQMHMHGPEVTL